MSGRMVHLIGEVVQVVRHLVVSSAVRVFAKVHVLKSVLVSNVAE